MLTVERVREVLDYNPETGVFRWKTHKQPQKIGQITGNFGGGDDGKYWRVRVDGKWYYGHRLAWFYVYGVWPTQLDHKDTIKHHNAILNLREATTVQNAGNMRMHRRNKLGFKGVRKRTPGCYEARLGIGGKDHVLGYFKSPEEAHAAYVAAAKEQFGEFARAK